MTASRGFGLLLALLCVIDTREICFGADDIKAPATVEAKELPADEAKALPTGQFVTLVSPIDDTALNRVSQVIQKLEGLAQTERRPVVLVLQIEPGASQFHHVLGLVRLLGSSRCDKITTVAWIPKTITGFNVLAALACKEIVMHPDAEMGDIGRGKPLEPEELQAVLAIGQRRHNPRINTALMRGMIDIGQAVSKIRVKVRGDEAEAETRIVTEEELSVLLKTNAIIDKNDRIKEAGGPTTFKGSIARDQGVLVTNTALGRADVADIYRLPREAMREEIADLKETGSVRLIRLEGQIRVLQQNFIQRQIDRALEQETKLLIFQFDAVDGDLAPCLELARVISELNPQQVRTAAYIPRRAQGGAAIVALGCDEIYMAPAATLGPCITADMRKKGGLFERDGGQLLNALQTGLKQLAERKKRPAALLAAMADPQVKVFQVTHRDIPKTWFLSETELKAAEDLPPGQREWIRGPILRETNGELQLTVDGRRALELKLAEQPVADWDELKQRLSVPANQRLVPISPTWLDRTVFVLNNPAVTVLILLIGIGCLYLEVHFMTYILGIISVICFSLFFWSHALGGSAGLLEVLLFVLGLGCLIMEIFVLQGFGVFGVTGILLVLTSLVMAVQTFSHLDFWGDMNSAASGLGTVSAALFGVIVMGALLGRFLPNIPFLDSMILAPPGGTGDDLETARLRTEPTNFGSSNSHLLNERGKTLTMLRPAGKARMGANQEILDVVSEGPFIAQGAEIVVVQIAGNRIIVREESA